MNLENFINHSRHRDYMSGVERDKLRIKQTGEVFTPTELVQEILDQLPEDQFTDPTKTFLDPTCGDGQFLSEVIIRKMEYGSTYEQALATTYGSDLMDDNCQECIRRLYGEGEIIRMPVETSVADGWPKDYHKEPGLIAIYFHHGKVTNIVQADGLVYGYNFGERSVPNKLSGLFETGLFS